MSGRRQFNSSHDSGIGEHDIADPPVVIGAGALVLNGGAEAPGNIDNGDDAWAVLNMVVLKLQAM